MCIQNIIQLVKKKMKAQKTNKSYKMVSKKIICIFIVPLSEAITITVHYPWTPPEIFSACVHPCVHTLFYIFLHTRQHMRRVSEVTLII